MSEPRSSIHFPPRSSIIAKVAASTALASLPVERFVHAAGDDTVKIAMVGCGGRGTGACVQAMNTPGATKLVAMCDVDEDQLAKSLSSIRAQHRDKVDVPPDRQFTGFEDYKKAIAEADVCILATSPGFRPIHFEEAVKQGKHVFMEKPVATDAPGVRKVLEAAKIAKKKGLKVGVGMQRRHQPTYQEAINRLHDGAIGDIVSMRVYWDGNARAGKERLPDEKEMRYQIRNWYYFTWLSGDHIVEQHIHNIDVMNWIKNGYPVRAQGMGGRQVRNKRINGQIYDHHQVEYEFADGSRCYSQCRQIRGCWTSVSEHAVGTKGTADLVQQRKLFQITGPNAWTKRLKKSEQGHQLEHYPLFKAIRENNHHMEAEYGALGTMTAILGRMATYSGKKVEFQDALNSKLELVPYGTELTMDSAPPVLPDADGWYPVAVPGKTAAL